MTLLQTLMGIRWWHVSVVYLIFCSEIAFLSLDMCKSSYRLFKFMYLFVFFPLAGRQLEDMYSSECYVCAEQWESLNFICK